MLKVRAAHMELAEPGIAEVTSPTTTRGSPEGAGLVSAEKRGRQQVQHARLDTLRQLMTFLAKDCCEGRAELCEPLIADLSCC